jgi:hypothetical protein
VAGDPWEQQCDTRPVTDTTRALPGSSTEEGAIWHWRCCSWRCWSACCRGPRSPASAMLPFVSGYSPSPGGHRQRWWG